MKKIIFCVLILINTVSAFSSGKKDPYWISNPYDGYSADKFIVACGSGTTNDDATKKAISEVSSVLKQDINAQEYVNQSFSSDGKNLSTYLANITTNTNVSDISGLSIKDKYKSKDGTYYVRAVLDKTTAGKYYSLLITKNAMEIDTLISESEKYLSTFTACKFLLNAYKIAKENDYYLDLLSVIKPESRKMLSYGNTSNVVAKLENAFKSITIAINVSGDDSQRIYNAIASVVNSYGITSLPVEKITDNTKYLITADISFEDIEKPSDSDIFFTRYILACSLTEVDTEKDLLTYTKNARQGKLSRREAQQSAIRAAEKIISEELSKKFGDLLK